MACSSSNPDPDQTRVDEDTTAAGGHANDSGGTSTDSSGQNVTAPLPGPGWGELQRVGNKINEFSTNMAGAVGALNEKGEAIVAWTTSPSESESAFAFVYAALYKNNAWQPPFTVCPKETPCQDPSVAINDRGDLAIGYERIINSSDETTHSTELWVKTASQWEWNDALLVSRAEPKGVGNYVDASQIHLDKNGRALAIWKETDTHGPGGIRLQSAYFDSKVWGTPIRLDQRLPSEVDTFVFEWNADGQGMAAWLDATHALDSSKPNGGETKPKTWARPFANGQWGTAHKLIEDPESADFLACTAPRVGVDGQGNAIVGFSHRSTTSLHQVLTRRYDQSTQKWGAVQVGVPPGKQPYLTASLDVNNKGEAALAWYADDPANEKHQLVHMRYRPQGESDWGSTVQLNEKRSSIDDSPVVRIQGDGHAWISWIQPAAHYPEQVRTRSVFGPDNRVGTEIGTEGRTVGVATNEAGHVLLYGLRTVIEHSPRLGYYRSAWARLKQPG